MKKVVSFAPDINKIYNNDFKTIGEILGFEAVRTHDVKELFSLITQDKDINTIIFDIDKNVEYNIDLIDIINSIHTIRKMQNYDDVNVQASSPGSPTGT